MQKKTSITYQSQFFRVALAVFGDDVLHLGLLAFDLGPLPLRLAQNTASHTALQRDTYRIPRHTAPASGTHTEHRVTQRPPAGHIQTPGRTADHHSAQHGH